MLLHAILKCCTHSKGSHKKLGNSLGGGLPPSSLTASICANLYPFLPLWNGKITPNMTTCREIFTFSWPLRGRGGSTQAVSLTAFFPFFFLITSLRDALKQNLRDYLGIFGRWRTLSLPLPPFWPLLKKGLFCLLGPGTILVFTKKLKIFQYFDIYFWK